MELEDIETRGKRGNEFVLAGESAGERAAGDGRVRGRADCGVSLVPVSFQSLCVFCREEACLPRSVSR